MLKVAQKERPVLLIDGDGSFGMTNMDLQTVSRYRLPIKMAVMNDSRQQMVWIWQKLFYDNKFLSVTNHNPDFAKLADAYDIPSVTCEHTSDLPRAVEKFLTMDGPVLGDFRVVPDICLPMVAPGKALDEMYIQDF